MKKYKIAVANTRNASYWKNIDITFEDFINRLKKPTRTAETQGEYKNLTKAKQDTLKDVGGFVCGYLKDGKRSATSLQYRSMLTLDADFAEEGFCELLELCFDYNYILHSTRKHEEDKPRYRLIIPFNRNCTPDEYEAVARYIANEIGIDMFDDSTYQANRLMYYPSVSQDQKYIFKSNICGCEINVDEILNIYDDWKDRSLWPTSSRVHKVLTKEIKKQQDPKEKQGIVGAFCRVYDVERAIDTFLLEIYQKCDTGARYTYLGGSTYAGAVIYGDGDFLYSNHATDPASSKLCNSFDLVRIHKFGMLDEDVKDNTPSNRLPSYLAMTEFAGNDKEVKLLIQKERRENALADFECFESFENDGEVDDSWLEKLETDSKGRNLQTINNVVLVLNNDVNLKNKIAFNEFSNRIFLKDKTFWENKKYNRAWEDEDTSNLMNYIEKTYGINKEKAIKHAFKLVAKNNSYHPVRNYLKSLKWDGVKRVENSIIDYLGAEDNEYVKAVTKVTFIGAVERVFKPGCKFDTMLVLVSKQGFGKSSFVEKIGVNWYSASLTTFKGKEAYEKLQSKWILEVAELSAFNKTDVNTIKQFVSTGSDNFRAAYAEYAKDYPRQCIFIGTSNTHDFLKDATGDRRFYPIDLINKPIKNIKKDLNSYEIGQLWAEAYQMFLNGEVSYLEEEKLIQLAEQEQKAHREEHPYQSIIENYLTIPLTDNWKDMSIPERLKYFRDIKNSDPLVAKGTVKRTKVCIMEIWIEALGGIAKDLDRMKSNEIKNCMLKVDGWEWSKKTLHFGGDYGKQKGFMSINSGS